MSWLIFSPSKNCCSPSGKKDAESKAGMRGLMMTWTVPSCRILVEYSDEDRTVLELGDAVGGEPTKVVERVILMLVTKRGVAEVYSAVSGLFSSWPNVLVRESVVGTLTKIGEHTKKHERRGSYGWDGMVWLLPWQGYVCSEPLGRHWWNHQLWLIKQTSNNTHTMLSRHFCGRHEGGQINVGSETNALKSKLRIQTSRVPYPSVKNWSFRGKSLGMAKLPRYELEDANFTLRLNAWLWYVGIPLVLSLILRADHSFPGREQYR